MNARTKQMYKPLKSDFQTTRYKNHWAVYWNVFQPLCVCIHIALDTKLTVKLILDLCLITDGKRKNPKDKTNTREYFKIGQQMYGCVCVCEWVFFAMIYAHDAEFFDMHNIYLYLLLSHSIQWDFRFSSLFSYEFSHAPCGIEGWVAAFLIHQITFNANHCWNNSIFKWEKNRNIFHICASYTHTHRSSSFTINNHILFSI